jgi:predicted membrane metal-binding protein
VVTISSAAWCAWISAAAIVGWGLVIGAAALVVGGGVGQLVLGGVFCLLGIRLWWVQWREL